MTDSLLAGIVGLLVLAVALWRAPLGSHSGGVLFGVSMSPDVLASDPAQSALRRFRRLLLCGVAASAIVAAGGAYLGSERVVVLALAAVLGLGVAGFQRGRTAIRGLRSGEIIGEAALAGGPSDTGPFLLAAAGPFLILALAYPVAARDGLQQAFIGCLLLSGMAALTRVSARRVSDPFGRTTLAVLIGVSYVLAGTAAARALVAPGSATFERAIAILPALATLVLVGLLLRAATRARRAQRSPGDGTPDDCWRWGMVYVNPDDPALFVGKRFGIGYSLNFGHPWSWWVLLVVIALIVLPMVLGQW